jgi:hypothetical protein
MPNERCWLHMQLGLLFLFLRHSVHGLLRPSLSFVLCQSCSNISQLTAVVKTYNSQIVCRREDCERLLVLASQAGGLGVYSEAVLEKQAVFTISLRIPLHVTAK